MSDIFEEVDEEIRKDKFSQLWKKYGSWLIACVAVILVSAVGFVQWQNYNHEMRAQSSAKFYEAAKMIDKKQLVEANEVLAELASDGTEGYNILAKFRAAGIKSEMGNHEAAGQIYAALAAEAGIKKLYRDLAKLYSIMQRIDNDDTADLSNELNALISKDNPWRFTARELAGVLALQQEDIPTAEKYFNMLADDPMTPAGLRQRAGEILQAIR